MGENEAIPGPMDDNDKPDDKPYAVAQRTGVRRKAGCLSAERFVILRRFGHGELRLAEDMARGLNAGRKRAFVVMRKDDKGGWRRPPQPAVGLLDRAEQELNRGE